MEVKSKDKEVIEITIVLDNSRRSVPPPSEVEILRRAIDGINERNESRDYTLADHLKDLKSGIDTSDEADELDALLTDLLLKMGRFL